MSHIKYKHDISAQHFSILYPNVPLVSDLTKKRCSKTSKQRGCGYWNKGKVLTDAHRHKISLATRGEKNPFYGKKHTSETRRKMSNNHADFTGEKNPLRMWLALSPINRDQYKKICKNKWKVFALDKIRASIHWDNVSKRMAKAHIQGKVRPYGRGHLCGTFYSERQKKKIHYDSSWELSFLEFCEFLSDVSSFDRCKFYIPYKINGKKHRYVPDFMVDNYFVVEIKPLSLLDLEINKAKLKALRKYCKHEGLEYLVFSDQHINFMKENINMLKEFWKESQ